MRDARGEETIYCGGGRAAPTISGGSHGGRKQSVLRVAPVGPHAVSGRRPEGTNERWSGTVRRGPRGTACAAPVGRKKGAGHVPAKAHREAPNVRAKRVRCRGRIFDQNP